MTVYLLDTNVILTDSNVLASYADKTVYLPDTVLAEVDKVKIGRADSDTRYKGREFTRNLFDLCDGQSLIDGVTLSQGGTLTVLPFDTKLPMPEGYSIKNPDDKILVAALRLKQKLDAKQEQTSGQASTQVHASGQASQLDPEQPGPASSKPSLVLVTNDLNMLLKAQSLGIATLRHDDELNLSPMRRFIIRPFQKHRTAVMILIFASAIFIATLVVTAYNLSILSKPNTITISSEYRSFLTEDQSTIIDALVKLQTNPTDAAALATMGDGYLNLYEQTVTKDPALAVSFAQKGCDYYRRSLNQGEDNQRTKINYGILSFYSGTTDVAVTQLESALATSPDDLQANYYRAIVAWQGQGDADLAQQLFQRTIDLAGDDESAQHIKQSSQTYLERIKNERNQISNPAADGIVL